MESTGEIKSYSQSKQDLFVLKCFPENYKGFFVDIGAGYNEEQDGEINSNSLLLEQNGWKGIALDISMDRLKNRKCVTHAEKIGNPRTISEILESLNCPKLIDYVSIDVDGIDYEILENFIHGGYQFKVLTYEHDLYSHSEKSKNSKYDAFLLLSDKSYIRYADNVSVYCKTDNKYYSYEDWYINPEYISYKDLKEKLNENR